MEAKGFLEESQMVYIEELKTLFQVLMELFLGTSLNIGIASEEWSSWKIPEGSSVKFLK